MRLQLTVDDNLSSDLKRRLTALLEHLSAHPEFVQEISLEGEDVDDSFFTPEIVAEIRMAQAEARTGNNISIDQYRAESPERRARWQANRPA